MTTPDPNPVPTSHPPAAEAPAPAWPTVLGIIAIIFGAAGIFGAILSIGMMFILGWFADVMPPGQEGMFLALEEQRVPLISMYSVWMVLAALLLVAGIGLAKRRWWAIPTTITWVVLKILFGFIKVYVDYTNALAQFEASQEQIKNDPKMENVTLPAWFDDLGTVGAILAATIGLLWGWALPIFLLIWFSRRPVKEHARTWRETPE